MAIENEVDTNENDLETMERLIDGKDKVKDDVEEDDVDTTPNDLILEDDDEDKIDVEVKDEKEEKNDKEEIPDVNLRGIDLKKIKDKFPEFAKTNEFRELRNAYYREGQFTEIFATIEDAREASENNVTFNKLNNDLVAQGKIEPLLIAISNANKGSFVKVARSFLPTLNKLDPNLYAQTVEPLVKNLAKSIHAEGLKLNKRNGDQSGDSLVYTARNIMQWAFQDADLIDEPVRNDLVVDDKPNDREVELTKREEQLASRDHQVAMNTATRNLDRHLDKQILDGLDPDGKFNEFTRNLVLEKIKTSLDKQIANDPSHLRRMTSLWDRAKQSGYDKQSLSRVISAYLERARPIIPTLRNRFRSELLKGKSEVIEDDDKPMKIVSKGVNGRPPSRDGKSVSVKNVDTKKIDYTKTSDDDIFNGKVKVKA